MEQFTLQGSSLPHRLYSRILAFAQARVRKYEDKVVDVVSVKLPSAFCMVIRFTILNKNEKYEIVLQGQFQSAYKQQEEGKPVEYNTEILIRENLKDAYKIG
jgi:hypothetical protein